MHHWIVNRWIAYRELSKPNDPTIHDPMMHDDDPVMQWCTPQRKPVSNKWSVDFPKNEYYKIPPISFICINYIENASGLLDRIMFTDQTNLFFSHTNIHSLVSDVNNQLKNWLMHKIFHKRFLSNLIPEADLGPPQCLEWSSLWY